MRETIQRYLVVVIKGQHKETPYKNWELLTKLDPGYKEYTDDEWSKMYHPEGLGLGVSLFHITTIDIIFCDDLTWPNSQNSGQAWIQNDP